MSFTNVALTGTVELEPGIPAPGAIVALTLSNEMTNGVTIIEPYTADTRTLADGTFTLTVPANDDSTTTPANTYYTVSITFGVQVVDTWPVVVPSADAPTVNLFTLARIGVGNLPTPTYGVQSVEGLNGNVVFGSPDGSLVFGTSGASVTIEQVGGAEGNVTSVTPTDATIETHRSGSSVTVQVTPLTFDAWGAASVAQGNAETYAFGITQAASVASESYALTQAQNASVNAVSVAETYSFGITQAASVAAEAYALATAQAASVNAVSVSELYALTQAQAASVNAVVVSEAYALTQAQASSVNAVAVSESYAFTITNAASTGAIATSEAYTQASSVATLSAAEAYALTQAQNASVNAVAVSEPYALAQAQASSVNAVAVSEAYALTTAQAASVNAAAVSDPLGSAASASVSAVSAASVTAGKRSATVTVGAANCAKPAQYDYLCTGVSDETTINAAIATLTSGGVCQLSEGTFYLGDGQVVCNLNNVMLRGMGMEATILAQGNSTTSASVSFASGASVNVSLASTASFPASVGSFAVSSQYVMAAGSVGTYQGLAPVVGQGVYVPTDSPANPILTQPTFATAASIPTSGSFTASVTSTTGWPSVGSFVVVATTGTAYTVNYTATTGTAYTTCTPTVYPGTAAPIAAGYRVYAAVASVSPLGTFTINGTCNSASHVAIGAPTTDVGSPGNYGLNPNYAPCTLTYSGISGNTLTGVTASSGSVYIPAGAQAVYAPLSPRQSHVLFGSTTDVASCFVRDLHVGAGVGPVNSGCNLKVNVTGRVNIENVHLTNTELDSLWLSNYETVNGTTTTIASGHDVLTTPEPGTIETWVLTSVPAAWGIGAASSSTWTDAGGTVRPQSPASINGQYALLLVDTEEIGVFSVTGASVQVIRGWGGTETTHTNASSTVSFFQRFGGGSECVMRNVSATAPGRDGISVGQSIADSKFYESYAAGGQSGMAGGRYGIWSRGQISTWVNCHPFVFGRAAFYHNSSVAYGNVRVQGGDFESSNGPCIQVANLGYNKVKNGSVAYGAGVWIEDAMYYNSLAQQVQFNGCQNVYLSRLKSLDWGNNRSIQANNFNLSGITNLNLDECDIAGGTFDPFIAAAGSGRALRLNNVVNGSITGCNVVATGAVCGWSIILTNTTHVSVSDCILDCGLIESGTSNFNFISTSVQLPIAQQPNGYTSGNSGSVTLVGANSVYGGAVTSVFGRSGSVIAQTGDYLASQVTNAADLSDTGGQAFNGPIGVAPVGPTLISGAVIFPVQSVDEGGSPNALYVYEKQQAGARDYPWAGPSTGAPFALARAAWDSPELMVQAVDGQNSPNAHGMSPIILAAAGTFANGFLSNRGVLSQMSTPATVTSSCYLYSNSTVRANSNVNANGWLYRARVRPIDSSYAQGGANTGSRLVVGMSSNFPLDLSAAGNLRSAVSTSNTSNAYFNYISANVAGGISDTSWHFTTSNGTVGNTTDTTVAVGASVTAFNDYDVYIFCPNGGTTIYWGICNLAASSTWTTGSTTTDTPLSATALGGGIGIWTQDATVRNLDYYHMYLNHDATGSI